MDQCISTNQSKKKRKNIMQLGMKQQLSKKEKDMIANTKKSIIICNNGYADGMPSIISSEITNLKKCDIHIMGLPHKTAVHHPKVDVLPPSSSEIIKKNRITCKIISE